MIVAPNPATEAKSDSAPVATEGQAGAKAERSPAAPKSEAKASAKKKSKNGTQAVAADATIAPETES